MGENSAIEWCHHTFNGWHGCVKVSPGCENCYAETLSNRWGNNIWGPAKTTERRLFGDKHWQEPLKWDKDAKAQGIRARVFSASMSDVFEDHPQVVSERARLINLINMTPNLIWLLLTKRPENIMGMLEESLIILDDAGFQEVMSPEAWLRAMGDRVWIGTSIEDQKRADERIPHLLKVPAAVRFLSMEPLLGPVDLHAARYQWPDGSLTGAITSWGDGGIGWVITGGESGPHARPMAPSWVRRIRDDCKHHGVAFFHKQWGEFAPCSEVIESPSYFGGSYVVTPDGEKLLIDSFRESDLAKKRIVDGQYMVRVGKKNAGRLLDGVEYSELPGQRLVDIY